MKLVHIATLLAAVSIIAGCSSLGSRAKSKADGDYLQMQSAYHDGNVPPEGLRAPRDISSVADASDPLKTHSEADYHFTLAESYSLEGLTDKAIEEFKLTLVYDPNSPQVRLRLGAEYLKKGLITESMEQVESAVDRDPKFTDARLLLAGLYGSLRMYDKAELQYREIMKADTSNLEAPTSLAVLMAEQKKYAEAIKVFEALSKNKNNENAHHAWYYMGRIYQEKEDYQQATMAYQKALQIKPKFSEAVISLSKNLESQKKKKDAIKVLEQYQDKEGPDVKVAETLGRYYLEAEEGDKAYRQFEIIEDGDRENLNVKVKMALILIEKKDFEKAAVKLKQILAVAPDSDKIRFYLAAVYEEIKDYDEAIAQFQQIPPSSSFFPESMVHIAYLQKTKGHTDRAIATIETAIEKQDDVEQFYALYASFLHERKEYPKARTMLEGAVQKFPRSEQLYFFLGSVHDAMGDKRKTLDSMKAVTALNPDHAQALNYIAYTYAELGENLDEAEVSVRRALKIRPVDAYIQDTLGWVLFKRGEIEQAVKVLEKAQKTKPDEAIIAEHLGDAYYRLQLPVKARGMYQRAAELERDEKNLEKIRAKITTIDQRYVPATGRAGRIPASEKAGN